MTEAGDLQSLEALLEEMAGIPVPVPADPEMRKELEAALGISFDDPASWAELERRWEAMKPALASLPPDPLSDASVEAEAVFQATVERLGEAWLDAATLPSQTPAIRMLLATHVIDAEVDNGGWPAVFYNSVDGFLNDAIEGYRLLGLEEHARLAVEIHDHGFEDEAGDDADWDRFDQAWSALPSVERVRAEYIRANPSEFSGG
jgi:hypothetical protein